MITDEDKRFVEEHYDKPYDKVAAVARENLLKAGCLENQIDFVLEYGGIYSAYENDLDCFKKFPEYAVMHLTTD